MPGEALRHAPSSQGPDWGKTGPGDLEIDSDLRPRGAFGCAGGRQDTLVRPRMRCGTDQHRNRLRKLCWGKLGKLEKLEKVAVAVPGLSSVETRGAWWRSL